MSSEERRTYPSDGQGEKPDYCEATSHERLTLKDADRLFVCYGAETSGKTCSSHPGLLALARILGRSAARAELRRTRRGALAITGMVDATLMVAALIALALLWNGIVRSR